MMFIHAEAVKSTLVSIFELVEKLVVQSMGFFCVVQFGRDVDPHTAIFFLEIFW
jgi:hypothetical protein